MGQHPVYNGVIKSKGAIKMTRKELQTMLKQLSEYQVNQISQTMQRFLALNQELAEIEPDTCPCCGDRKAVLFAREYCVGNSASSASPAAGSSPTIPSS